MSGPIDAVMTIHNAFRHDMADIDAAALAAARGASGHDAVLGRYRFFNEVLVWHARGEELAIFPALETVAPLVAEAYVRDHRALDSAYDALDAAIAVGDALETARAAAAFRFHLDLHLAKEDTHVYRLIRERVPVPEQGKAVGVMAGQIPQERFPELIAWMFPLVGNDDRESMIRAWQAVLPAEALAGALGLARAATGSDWAELARRIPGLEA
jgi:hypothetical protein